MAKSATKKKPSKQPDLFDTAPRAAKRAARKPPPAARRKRAEAPRAPSRRARRSAESGYTAKHIEVLEGLEPVRRRPGMYIGGTDEKALHHLFAEVIDNSMDEALAGHASWIEVEMEANGFVSVTDNGRGIPVDPHPKFKNKSALEVIMCMLHAGGKFDSKVYETSGGLHGVGVSVANALSERMEVEVAREQQLYRMAFERGKPKGKLEKAGRAPNRRGTKIRFRPDPQIFGPKAAFQAERVFKMARSKAYLFGGVEIRWHCAKELLRGVKDVPEKATFHFADGLKDYLASNLADATLVHPDIFTGSVGKTGSHGTVEWAIAWTADADGFLQSYCNTIPTADGGTHESGLRTALLRGLKDHAARAGQEKRASARDQRRRDDRRRLHALGVHPRAGIPGPDQGPARHRGGAENRRAGDQGPVRPLAVGQSAAGQQAAWISSSSAPRSGCAAARKRTSRARPRCASCACPASSPTARARPRKARRFSSSRATARRLGQAGARPPHAGGAAAARQDFERRVGRQGQAGAERAARRSDPGARLRHRRAFPRKGSALREGHHHDRRRRRRRAYRFAADHLLLPPDAEADRSRPALSRGAAALSPAARRQDRLCARRQAQRAVAEEGIQRQCQGGGLPLQGPRRNDGGAVEGNHHGPGQSARCCG